MTRYNIFYGHSDRKILKSGTLSKSWDLMNILKAIVLLSDILSDNNLG